MKILFLVTLIIGLIFGLGFILVPGPILVKTGIFDDPNVIVLVRNEGATLLAFVVLIWFSRKSKNDEFHQAVMLTMLTYWMLNSITFNIWQIAELSSVIGWVTAVMQIGLFLAYGMVFIRKYT